MPTRPLIRHLHIRTPISYNHGSLLQDHLVSLHQLARKTPSTHHPPPPTILTFSTTPTYTLGRRETESTVTQSQLDYLALPVHVPRTGITTSAEVIRTLRGGQTTFHGPGQLVIYPIFALDSPSSQIPTPTQQTEEKTSCFSSRYRITPKCYVRLLEKTTISLLENYGIRGMTTGDPGVWVSDEEKIAAVGVHLRRYVVSHGLAINVKTDLEWFDRIIACGLEGKRTTSTEKVLSVAGRKQYGGRSAAPGLEEVANGWVDEFASRLGFDVNSGDVVRDVTEEDIMGILKSTD